MYVHTYDCSILFFLQNNNAYYTVQAYMKEFIKNLQIFYKENKRDSLPWRKTTRIYNILLSEIMLQQTQVSRVLIKYKEFLTRFPNTQTLAKAPLRDVLTLWQGLGYNRRAKFLHLAAKVLDAAKPRELGDYTYIKSLPGVGQSTAGAILAFTQNKPVVFIETNIRAVILYHFFRDTKEKVSDKDIENILKQILALLPKDFGPRDFYYAMYDYGTHLKQTLGTQKKVLHQKSISYTKQSKFQGSRRQLRAYILKIFLEMKKVKNFKSTLIKKVLETKPKTLSAYTIKDITTLVQELEKEGMFS
jgi:A/G-specific adenine glycosylase